MDRRVCILASTPAAATEASVFVERAAGELGLGDDVRERMLMVIGEAVDNAAGHGNGFDPTKRVTLVCERDAAEVRLRIEDEGQGLPEGGLDGAELPDDPMDTSGRGLFIITAMADRTWLEANGRRLCLAWALPTDGAA